MSKKVLVSVDPSSTRSGLALWVNGKLTRCEAVKASSSKKQPPHARAVHHARATFQRVQHLVSLVPLNPSVRVVIEVPGSQGRQYSRGLVTMGMAVGAAVALLDSEYEVEMVPANIWTRLEGGRAKSKDIRADRIEEMFPEYERASDKGLDIADAIGLGAWRLGLFEKPRKPR